MSRISGEQVQHPSSSSAFFSKDVLIDEQGVVCVGVRVGYEPDWPNDDLLVSFVARQQAGAVARSRYRSGPCA